MLPTAYDFTVLVIRNISFFVFANATLRVSTPVDQVSWKIAWPEWNTRLNVDPIWTIAFNY
jgi:hypothetical protein